MKTSQKRDDFSVERPVYDLTVFKIHFGLLTIKMYSKGERVLRIEAIVHNARRMDCGYGIDRQYDSIQKEMQGSFKILGIAA